MTEYSTVACAEVHITSAEEVSQFVVRAHVTLHCAWASRYALVDDIFLNLRPWPHRTSGLLLYPENAAITPLPGAQGITSSGGQMLDYEIAEVNISYSNEVLEAASESIEPSIEQIPLDFQLFRWDSGRPVLEGEAPPFILRSFTLARTRYNLATIPTDALDLIGHTNNATYTSDILGLSFDADKLLYLPGGFNRGFRGFSATGFTATVKFGYKPQGWNKYWDSMIQAWSNMFVINGLQHLAYPQGDLSTLFA